MCKIRQGIFVKPVASSDATGFCVWWNYVTCKNGKYHYPVDFLYLVPLFAKDYTGRREAKPSKRGSANIVMRQIFYFVT